MPSPADFSNKCSFWPSPTARQMGGAVVTADPGFASALALTQHGEAVVTLADYARR